MTPPTGTTSLADPTVGTRVRITDHCEDAQCVGMTGTITKASHDVLVWVQLDQMPEWRYLAFGRREIELQDSSS